ncbi:YibE/F family protein [Thiospirochaeta perfilievii]|uniref:YibE/F family protein n=1 Tax=Thiospirochaeta perfilievii TaxID=252967 RepID=A0A5C1QAF5_9SPIO|nr:YibE/F family protein [Thiospirochaeta perfilievii]QEN05113.1 YibE/F family protein [Thiospirochaeta perfilievii]
MVVFQKVSAILHKVLHEDIFPWLILLLSAFIIIISLNYIKIDKYFSSDFVIGRVLSVLESNLDDDPYVPGRKLGKQELVVNILYGEDAGKKFEIYNTLTKGHNILAREGYTYVFSIREEMSGDKVVWLYSYNRVPLLASLLLLFIVLVLFIAGKKGFRSLVGLLFTGVIILFVLAPLILRGIDPIFISIISLSLITVVSFLLISGFNNKSLISILGTLGGIISAGIICYIASKLAHLSGINMEKGEQILYIAEDYGIRINGFLFISILIASSGAVMDVAMSITSSLMEITKHNRDISSKDLFSSGMDIGRDLIGTMINTLILAFAGSSFTLLLMVVGLSMSFNQYINIPLISIEIIQGIAGSIGIILTVPLTNIAFIILEKRRNKNEEEISKS